MKVFSHEDGFLVQLVCAELEKQGIPYVLKNQYASGAMGELAPQDTLQEVWLLDESWGPKVLGIIKGVTGDELDRNLSHAEWQCVHCKEWNEANFGVCWNCQAPATEH